MAKNVSITEALSVLAEAGINVGEEYADAIAELTRSAFLSRAVEIFAGNDDNLPGKLVEGDATEWASDMFDLAERMSNEVVGNVTKVQGGAVRMVRVFGIDTPNGHLKVELKSE